MMLNPDSPRGMLRAQADEARRLAQAQDKQAEEHDKLAASCRTAAKAYRERAATFDAAQKHIQSGEDKEARRGEQ